MFVACWLCVSFVRLLLMCDACCVVCVVWLLWLRVDWCVLLFVV